jgi:hypothetical protein
MQKKPASTCKSIGYWLRGSRRSHFSACFSPFFFRFSLKKDAFGRLLRRSYRSERDGIARGRHTLSQRSREVPTPAGAVPAAKPKCLTTLLDNLRFHPQEWLLLTQQLAISHQLSAVSENSRQRFN